MFFNASIDLNQDELFFLRHAEQVQWYKSAQCPCGATPDVANNNCPVCGGLGRLYPDPPQLLNAVLSQIELDLALPEIGLAISGDMFLSENPKEHRNFGRYDIIMPTWEQGLPLEGQILTRGSGLTDIVWYRIADLESVYTVDVVTGQITSYKPDVDIMFNNRTLTWINGPPAGTLYSVKYSAIFEWAVMVPGIPRFERGSDLGQKVILRKRHIVLPNLPDILQD